MIALITGTLQSMKIFTSDNFMPLSSKCVLVMCKVLFLTFECLIGVRCSRLDLSKSRAKRVQCVAVLSCSGTDLRKKDEKTYVLSNACIQYKLTLILDGKADIILPHEGSQGFQKHS